MINNLVTAALRAKRARYEQQTSANAHQSWAEPFLTPASDAPAEATRAGWEAVIPGQSVPIQGEEVGYAQPCYYE